MAEQQSPALRLWPWPPEPTTDGYATPLRRALHDWIMRDAPTWPLAQGSGQTPDETEAL